MPLKTGRNKKVVGKNIGEMVRKYTKTGTIGTSKPASKSKAVKQATAIALDKAGMSTKVKSVSVPKPIKQVMRKDAKVPTKIY
jgi:hypothetical protein